MLARSWRSSLAHEAKHCLDYPFTNLYPPQLGMTGNEVAEAVCDHFAACLLMPRPWVKRAWASGTQDVNRLAARFDVSVPAIRRRLDHIGLTERRTVSRHGVAA